MGSGAEEKLESVALGQLGDHGTWSRLLAVILRVPECFLSTEWIERQRANNRIYYYHRKFRRVPELTECLEDDVVCHYEAEMQWKRDFLVDQQILKIIKDRVGHCKALHGENADQKCAKEVQHYKDVIKIYWNKYGDLGAYGTARKCLMKQKEQMIAERKARKAAEAEVAAEE
nr:NADH dehydrogenase [ubiquinone] 1 beta subcomplex subunit 10 [Pogona vitticeps]